MIKKFIDSLKSLEGRTLCLLFCMLPLLLHTSYVLIENENSNLSKWITIPISIIASLGIELTILVFTLEKNKSYKWISYCFALFSLFINILYGNKNFLGYIIAIILPFSALVYSELIKNNDEELENKPKRGRPKLKEEKDLESIEEIY